MSQTPPDNPRTPPNGLSGYQISDWGRKTVRMRKMLVLEGELKLAVMCLCCKLRPLWREVTPPDQHFY